MLRGALGARVAAGLVHPGQRARSSLAYAAAPEDATSASALSQAKPFHEIPGPKAWPIVGNSWRFLKGGTYGHLSIVEQQMVLHEEFGDIVRLSGIMGHCDQLWIYNPQLVETMLRNEGRWPHRMSPESIHYYRTVLRKEQFNSLAGTMTSQGEEWQSFRSKVNQPLMQPRSVFNYVKPINEVADDFLDKIRALLDHNKELPANFIKDLHKWSVESIAAVALDTRMGCLRPNLAPNSEPQRLIDAAHTILDCMLNLDWKPSPWKYISTPSYRRFVAAMDVFTEITDKYIKVATANMKQRLSNTEQSILERLLMTEGPAVANLMATDMLFGGVDTTSNLAASVLFHLATNAEPQEKLAKELQQVLPNPKDTVTNEALEEMPYLKACIKESLRIFPITFGNLRRTQTDIVLGGYRVPKDVDVICCNMIMSRDEKHYPRPTSFEPERWLRGSAQAHSAHPFVTLPFGFGPRTCVGRRFAELEVQVLISKIIRNFKLEYHHGDQLLYETTLMNAITNPLKFRLIARE